MKAQLKKRILACMQKYNVKEGDWEEGFTETETEPLLRTITESLCGLGEPYERMAMVMVWNVLDDYGFGGDAELYAVLTDAHSGERKLFPVTIPLLDQHLDSFVSDLVDVAEGHKEHEQFQLGFSWAWDHNAYVVQPESVGA